MHTPSAVSHLVSVRAHAGHSAHVGARLSTLIAPSLRAPGCLAFNLQHSMSEPDVWVISGAWAAEHAMNAWFSAPELQVFADLVSELLVSSLDFQTFANVSASQAHAHYSSPRMAG
ncbi:putative quinol monooxygenase [Pseudomonas sp. NPDC090202]|uniref:putative quinol monooxygenase n=1 Tax=unclassified Pseudomonas TaxID=196821 RepID=UPI0038113B31